MLPKRLKVLTLLILMIGLSALTGCSAKLTKDLQPTKPYQPILINQNPTTTDLAIALTQCIADRELLYLDFERIQKNEKKVNKRLWEIWK